MSLRRTLAVGAAVAAVLVVGVSANAVGFKPGTVTSADIKDGNVRSNDIKDGGVYSSDLHNGTIRLADLAPSLNKQILADQCLTGAGVDFAINDNGPWTVYGDPFAQKRGTITADDTGSGLIHLATYPDAGEYADAGVIVPIGTVGSRFADDGSFNEPGMTGTSTEEVAINLYVDVDGNGKYLNIGDGVYVDNGGDQVLNSVDGESTTRSDLNVAATDATHLWAWVGVSGDQPQTAALTRFAGHDLALC